jgi:putative hydrolase of the HAD superfamily
MITLRKLGLAKQDSKKMGTSAVLLDLGNVVLGVDFRRVFDYWSKVSNTPKEHFYSRWSLDKAYKDHEKGLIDFKTYSAHLSEQFHIKLEQDQWLAGWNQLWTKPIKSTITLLPVIASKYKLYALTNTNRIHADFFKNAYQTELSHFEKIYISSELGLRKPDAECFDHVCNDIGLPPQEVLFLDDTREHVLGANKVGVNAHQVSKDIEASQILISRLAL